MLIAGWGKNSKKLADAGLQKCPNCGNVTTFEIMEIANYASAYLIRIAKWKKQFYIICSICDAGYELTEEKKKELLKLSVELPSNSEIINIWNDIDSLCDDYLKDSKDMEIWNKYVMYEMIKKGNNKLSIEYVLTYFNENLVASMKMIE